jgi:proliferating cell nuclear antigen
MPFFSAVMPDASVLSTLIGAVADIVTQAEFVISPIGLSLCWMSSDNVALVVFNLPSGKDTVWDSYECGNSSVAIGTNFEKLAKIFSAGVNSNCALRITYELNDDVFTLEFENHKGGGRRKYVTKLIVLDQERRTVPPTEFSCVFEMPSQNWIQLCRHMDKDLGADAVRFIVADGKIRMEALVADDLINLCSDIYPEDFDSEDVDAVFLDMVDPVNITVAAKYLSRFSKGAKFGPRVTFSFKADLPVCFGCSIEEKGHICFYLAPRIDTDE